MFCRVLQVENACKIQNDDHDTKLNVAMQVIRMGFVVWKVDFFFFIFGAVVEFGPKIEVPRKHLQVGAPNLKSIAPNSINCALTKWLD